ncbi:hypothetical protein [Chryseobacterium gleum]|uniref:hypothetical protein n=1 Tax=Chryseobacterium gleum TaxID=250 RepID=UPI0028967772|nr:hypothetical protein [Chryseobacterium gleum]
MELLENYKGAVFFVDILGISALTNSKIELDENDFTPWLDDPTKFSNQFLGAAILAKFRDLLSSLGDENTNLKITQLSDCAFVWSKKIEDVVVFCSKFMHHAVNNGILCRGGLAYGEIIETNQFHKLGRFILGDAVTQAAKLESISKGCRVLINQDLPHELFHQNDEMFNKIAKLFQPFDNTINFITYDEFKWYMAPELEYKNQSDLSRISFREKVEHTKNRLILANKLRCSTKFNWNSKTTEGQSQLIPSIRFLSENCIDGVMHNFEWKTMFNTRGEEKELRIKNEVKEYRNYREYKPVPTPDDWE